MWCGLNQKTAVGTELVLSRSLADRAQRLKQVPGRLRIKRVLGKGLMEVRQRLGGLASFPTRWRTRATAYSWAIDREEAVWM